LQQTIVSDRKSKPVLDEQTFGKLLEAAYVLQEHSRDFQSPEPQAASQDDREQELRSATAESASGETASSSPSENDYTLTLAHIVETQHQIQTQHLEVVRAMALVAERVARITNASSAAVGTIEGENIRYRAGSGTAALPVGTEIKIDSALSSVCLRIGEVVRCADVNPELLFDAEECRRRGIQSLIAVPIYYEGNIVGALENYFPRTYAFSEQDVHTCQLMAGLVSEAWARNAEHEWKKSLAVERATMMQALGKLQPSLEASSLDLSASDEYATDRLDARERGSRETPGAPGNLPCWKCGHELVAKEQFCGKCGSPRGGEIETPSMPAKVASLWRGRQQNTEEPLAGEMAEPSPAVDGGAWRKTVSSDLAASEDELPDWLVLPEPLASDQAAYGEASPTEITAPKDSVTPGALSELLLPKNEPDLSAGGAAPKDGQVEGTWNSAAKTRDWLETLAASETPSALTSFWQARRGDIYLVIAVILVAGVIRWGIWSNDSVGATGTGGSPAAGSAAANRHKDPAPDADLTTFEKLLVSLGLAEAPSTPERKGNADTQVWVDLHTALYYCPGSDLYGKTPKGKFTSQRDAQLDQFEPAYRKACE
jgi:GAF domain-containing protein